MIVGVHVTAVRSLDSHTPSEGELGRLQPCTRAGTGSVGIHVTARRLEIALLQKRLSVGIHATMRGLDSHTA